MNIVFNCLNSGLNNNGGSRTLLLCQKQINSMGHNCLIASSFDKFTWFDHKKPIRFIPANIDALISTACTTVSSTLRNPTLKKFWYIRGHEIWVPSFNEEKLIKLYKTKELIKIVNSKWLQKLLNDNNIPCFLVNQGIDIHEWQNLNIRKNNNKITIGCLYSNRKTKGWEDFVKLKNLLGNNYSYVSYGNYKNINEKYPFLSEYYSSPNKTTLNKLYSKCNFWFAPTKLEGLHNPPMEAALCGAQIIGSNSKRNGMIDYLINDKTGHTYSDINEVCEIIKKGNDNDIINEMKKFIIDNMDRKKCMENFINIIK